jgi:cupin 2 domain-containing protein
MTGVVRGRLLSPGEAPALGERTQVIARIAGVSVEQILSGDLAAPVEYLQAHDEWVVVLHGAAVIEVDGERLPLGAGDWVFLPANVPHRLMKTEPSTSWLALHGPSEGSAV